MNFELRIEKGEVPVRPLKIVVYGVEGVGKSTLASEAPNPVFADAERGTMGLPVHRFHANVWEDLLGFVTWLEQSDHKYETFVLDTLDSIERLLQRYVCMIHDVDELEKVGGGFGKGWSAIAEHWGKFLTMLDRLQEKKGMHIVALAHADATRFADPDGSDYNRWSLRLHKKGASAWKGWCEDMLFATREVFSGKKDKGKGRGGQRVLYTKWTPGREAKNRHNLPDKLELSWRALDAALMANVKSVAKNQPAPASAPKIETDEQNVEPEQSIEDVKTEIMSEEAHGEHDHSNPFPELCANVEELCAQLKAVGRDRVADLSFKHSQKPEIKTSKAALDALILRQHEVLAETKKGIEDAKIKAAAKAAVEAAPVDPEPEFVAPF